MPDPDAIDREVPNAARIYDYLLGGGCHYDVDRQAALAATGPIGGIDVARTHVQANRLFLVRAVRYLVREAGIRQFLDIGAGIPNATNVAATAQAADPTCRIVSVDNDPTVLAHAAALLTSTPQGAAEFVDADLRDLGKVLREARHTLDFDQPVAVMLIAILHFLADDDDPSPASVPSELLAPFPSGSYVAISHWGTDVPGHHVTREVADRFNQRTRDRFHLRSRTQVTRFFDGLELVHPGVVPLGDWHPDGELTSTPIYGGVARKP